MSGRITRDHRYTVTPEHLILDPRVGHLAFRLWCRLDRFAGENGAAYPTRETLAIELDCSPATVDRAKTELVTAGWLKVVQKPGDANDYILTTAPTKEVEKLIREARKARVEATAGRREARSSRRKAAKRGASSRASVNGSSDTANVQVSDGGVLTGDDPSPSTGGVLMGDDPGVLTGDDRGVLTGDDHKEATPKGSIREGDSDPSLRSGSADAARGDNLTPRSEASEHGSDTLLPVEAVNSQVSRGDNLTPRTEEPVEEQPNPFTVAGDFLNWFEATHNGGQPVMERNRTKAALAKSFIAPAFAAGATLDQVKRALAKCLDRGAPTEFPSKGEWRARLREEMTGAVVVQFPGRGRSYNDEETHGTQEERQARLDALKATPKADLEAEVDEMFQPRRQRPGQ